MPGLMPVCCVAQAWHSAWSCACRCGVWPFCGYTNVCARPVPLPSRRTPATAPALVHPIVIRIVSLPCRGCWLMVSSLCPPPVEVDRVHGRHCRPAPCRTRTFVTWAFEHHRVPHRLPRAMPLCFHDGVALAGTESERQLTV